MNWKIFAAIVIMFCAFSSVFIWLAKDEDNQQKEWQQFVMQHRCSIIPSKWFQTNRWQCDGFQIEHY